MTNKTYVKDIIIGSGVSGVMLAGLIPNAVVLSNTPIGGLIANTMKNGFSFDFGGHVYTTGDKRINKMMRHIPHKVHDTRKAFFGVEHMVPFPVQDHAEDLFLTIKPALIKEVKNFQDYSASVLGVDFTNNFMGPFNRRVWSTPMSQMDFDWVYGRVKSPSEDKSKWGMNSSFVYAKGEDIVDFMWKLTIPAKSIFLERTVMGCSGKELLVNGPDNELEIYSFDNLYDTSGMFLDLPTNNILTIGVGLNQKVDYDFHWVYPRFGQPVHRITLLSRYMDGLTPSEGQDSLLLEVPFNDKSKLSKVARNFIDGQYSDERFVEQENAVRQLLVEAEMYDAVDFDINTVWHKVTSGYPIPVIGHREIVKNTKRELLSHNIYLAGRWGAHGYYNLQHILDDAEAVVKASKGDYYNDYLDAKFYYKETE